jgi:hypothetical protein
LQVTGADKLTLVCGNLLVGSARISFVMRSRVFIKALTKSFTRKILLIYYQFVQLNVLHVNV